jgi:hypothetical protein
LAAASNEQYESIPDDEITLLARKFYAWLPRGCFECCDTTHFIADCPKRKKLDSSNKYNYYNNNQNDSSNKGNDTNKHRFGDKKKKKL